MAIPADAPHVKNAHLFIDYLLRPEVAAQNSNLIKYANAVSADLQPLDPSVRNDPGVFPPAEVRARLTPERAAASGVPAAADPHVDPSQDRKMNTPPDTTSPGVPAAAAATDPAAYVRIANVTKKFGDFTAVDNVSLDIRRGEIFCLLGGSGSGKTTLLRMLAGFETPTSGTIYIDGADMSTIPPYERPVNMMFQSYALFPHMTVEKNVAFGLEQEGLGRVEIRRQVERDTGNREDGRLRGAQAAPALRRPAPARRAGTRAG